MSPTDPQECLKMMRAMLQDRDSYPVLYVKDGRKRKNACLGCADIWKKKLLEAAGNGGYRKVLRGTMVVCDYCGKQIPETTRMSLEH